MGWGAAIAGGLGAIGSIYAANKSASSAKAVNKMQIDWERERAKNAHQWEVKDLQKAGLNPILSAGGSGAVTGGISPVTPDTSGYANAASNMANSAKAIGELDLFKSQEELNTAEKGKTEAQTNQITIQNSNLDKSMKKDIEKKEAEIAKMNVETRYQEESYQHRLTQQMAETEQAVAKGRIDINNAQFLANYGITREEALSLGEKGMQIVGQWITAGMSAFQVSKGVKEMLKVRKRATTSAKKVNYRQQTQKSY